MTAALRVENLSAAFHICDGIVHALDRVGIARASGTRLLVLDEPTAALDVSVLKLLQQIKTELGLSYILVSHDLNVVRLLCDRVVVMYFGRVIECAPAQQVFNAPRHPYTKSLIAAVPTPPASPAIRAARPARPDPAPPAPPPNPPLALRDCSRR